MLFISILWQSRMSEDWTSFIQNKTYLHLTGHLIWYWKSSVIRIIFLRQGFLRCPLFTGFTVLSWRLFRKLFISISYGKMIIFNILNIYMSYFLRLFFLNNLGQPFIICILDACLFFFDWHKITQFLLHSLTSSITSSSPESSST
jgi:hypothetical protein